MNFEQKTASIVNILSRDYINLIGIDGIGMYSFLMRTEATKLGNFQMSVICQSLGMSQEVVSNIIKKLVRCGLMEIKLKSKDKYFIKTLDILPISSPEKLHFVDMMFEEKIINIEQKREMLALLKTIQTNQGSAVNKELDSDKIDETNKLVKSKTKMGLVNTDLFDTQNRRRKDTGPALLDIYYKTISKYFNQFVVSQNKVVEANMLNTNMRKHGDSPEKVIAMFEYVGSLAKSREEIDRAKQIDYYIKHRTEAYYRTFTNPSQPTVMLGVEESKPQEDVDIKYVKEMYEYYKRNSMASDIIVAKLIDKYGQVKVDEFLKTMV